MVVEHCVCHSCSPAVLLNAKSIYHLKNHSCSLPFDQHQDSKPNPSDMHRTAANALARSSSSSSSSSLCCVRQASSSSSMRLRGMKTSFQHVKRSSKDTSNAILQPTSPSQRRHYAASNLQNQPPAGQQQRDDAVQKPADSDQDYHGAFAGPAIHTLGVATRIFRISVYASVGLIATATALYLSLHAYVEYIALHGGSRIPGEADCPDAIFLPEELVPAFSGAHRGGGTDPSIPWRARNAARAAWIALHLSSGGISSGGAGQIRDVAVPDGAWLSAESYLKFALQEIEKQNAASPESEEKTRGGYRELQTQLASLQSKLAGPRGLREARANLMALLQTLPPWETLSSNDAARWLELQRRLAAVNFQLAGLEKSAGSSSRQQEALQQLESALLLALTGHSSQEHVETPAITGVLPTQKSTSSFSIKSLWSRDSGTSSAAPTPAIASISSDSIVRALNSAERALTPSAKRAVSRMLIDDVSLSASLRRLSRAEAVCNASLDYIRSVVNGITSQKTEDQLYKTSLSTQVVFLQSYLAELLAAQQSARDLVSLNSKSDANTRNILNEAVEAARNCVNECDSIDRTPGFNKSCLRGAYDSVRAAAQRSAGLAHSTRALLAEVKDQDHLSALQDYEAAHNYANALKASDTDYSTVHSRTLEGIRRCREKLSA